MKRYIKPIIVAVIIALGISAFTACKKDKTETSAPVTEENENTEEKEPEKTASEENENKDNEDVQKENLTLEIGNDIGRNISKLNIRPDSQSDWTEISIDDGIWKSGYMIPVKIEAESIPNPEDGWEIEVTFSDDSSTKIFENVPLNSQKSIILTDEGAVFS